MFALTSTHRFFLYRTPCDMRKGFNSLAALARTGLGRHPLSGEVFVFLSRNRTTIKLLQWQHGGFVLYHKRLEQGRFAWPSGKEAAISWTDLVHMVEGIEVIKAKHLKRYTPQVA